MLDEVLDGLKDNVDGHHRKLDHYLDTFLDEV